MVEHSQTIPSLPSQCRAMELFWQLKALLRERWEGASQTGSDPLTCAQGRAVANKAQVCVDPGDRFQGHQSHAAVAADSAGLSVGAIVLVWVPLCIGDVSWPLWYCGRQ